MLLLSLVLFAQLPADYQPGHCGTAMFQSRFDGRIRPITGVRQKPSPRLGEQRPFWLMNMGIMPPGQIQFEATCRGVGNHCYLFVEDSSWNVHQMDSTDATFILERFDHRSPRDSTKGVWQHNTGTLGMPPDTDHDSLIYLMYYDIAGFHGYTFDGFWMYFDEYPDSIAYPAWGYHSNECEIVYLDDYPNDPGTDYRVAIAAHEFAHMIHWNYDPAESLWVNEGCAELAMWLYGSPDPISGFNSAPDNDLILWDGQWADYIQTYLFFLYLYEQYGERVGEPLIRYIVANQWQSIEGVDSSFAELGLPQRFQGVFNDWVIANFMDDTIAYGGRYGYYGERLPAFSLASTHSTYPVDRTGTVKRWAGKYFKFSRGTNLNLGFDGEDYSQLKARVIERDTINQTFVLDSIPLDSLLAGSIVIPDFGTIYQHVFLVPTNNTPEASQNSFRYTATASGIEEADSPRRPASQLLARVKNNRLLAAYTARVNGKLSLRLYAPTGSLVAEKEIVVRQGPNFLELDVNGVPAGSYFLSAEQGNQRSIAKVALVR